MREKKTKLPVVYLLNLTYNKQEDILELRCDWDLVLRKRKTFLEVFFSSEQLICPGNQPGVLNLSAEHPKGRFKISHTFPKNKTYHKIFSSTWQLLKKKVLFSL